MPEKLTGTRVEELEYSEPPSVEAGTYDATFVFLEAVDHEKFGPRWRWHFLIPGAAEDGGDFPISKWTSTYLSKGSRSNDIVAAIRGRKFERGEKAAKVAAELEGRPCRIVVSRDDEGWNKIETVWPPASSKPPAKPAGTPLAEMPTAAAVAAIADDPDYAEFLAAKRARIVAALEPMAGDDVVDV